MEDRRRMVDPKIDTIVMMVTENTKSIGELTQKLDQHIEDEEASLQEMKDSIAPVLELQHDIAAVGRMGKVIKAVVLWGTIVGGALVGALEWFDNLGDN